MVRVIYNPDFSHTLQYGSGFPVFKSARLKRGFALRGEGVISSFFAKFLLPFARKRVAPIALRTASKAARDIIVKKKPFRKVLKKRLKSAGKQIIKAAVAPTKNSKKKHNKKQSNRNNPPDIFTNL